MLSAKASDKQVDCKRCGAPSERKWGVGSSKFAHRPDGPGPQNTGASSVDHDIDVVIGRDSELRLTEMQKRQDYKRRVMHANNTDGDYLSRLDNGEYFVMTETERVAAKKARLANQDAMKRISKVLRERKQRASEMAAS